VAQAVANYLSRVGIRTDLDAVPSALFFPQRFKRTFSLTMMGWLPGTGEASEILRNFVATEDRERGLGAWNAGGYHSEAFDAALSAASTEMNDNARGWLLRQATLLALNDNALIPLYWETAVWAYKDKYEFIGRADKFTDVDNLSFLR
jgi:peptide/nickel transport system substrate-binding protein